ncbi:MAG TPA: hypothetical protein VNJ52_10875 [Patescibacteria group bacterium]|nr:hypothetical protein [Patescibacteria group bacterium]
MYRLLRLLFGRHAVNESVATQARFDACPEAVWNQMKFYEEVPGRPPWLLRRFLPSPVRTEGDKGTVGSIVHCAYSSGELFKRITTVDEPRMLGFEVVRQQLGIEDCILTRSGSYRISGHGSGASVVLTTNYQARLRPRRLWRAVEKILARRLHRHILGGMRAALSAAAADARSAPARRLTPETAPSGGLACTPSRSHSPR